MTTQPRKYEYSYLNRKTVGTEAVSLLSASLYYFEIPLLCYCAPPYVSEPIGLTTTTTSTIAVVVAALHSPGISSSGEHLVGCHRRCCPQWTVLRRSRWGGKRFTPSKTLMNPSVTSSFVHVRGPDYVQLVHEILNGWGIFVPML